MSYEYDEVYKVYDERFPRARKAHECGACGETIPVGHHYARIGIIDDTVKTLKRCMRCQRLHEHLRSLCEHGVWPDERLNCGMDYEEEWGELPADVADLAFALPGEVT